MQQLHDWRYINLPKRVSSFLIHTTFRVRFGQSLFYPTRAGQQGSAGISTHAFYYLINGKTSVWKCLYGDDLALFYSANATAKIKLKMQDYIVVLVENANNIGFSFLSTKTTCVHFCRKRGRQQYPTLAINGVRLFYSTVIKFLSLIYHRQLTWNHMWTIWLR